MVVCSVLLKLLGEDIEREGVLKALLPPHAGVASAAASDNGSR